VFGTEHIGSVALVVDTGLEIYIYGDETRYVHIILIGKHHEKRLLGRPRCKWENNIKMDVRKLAYKKVNCIEVMVGW
jgi:hypothetical protein